MNPATLQGFKSLFVDNPLAAICGAQLLAIGILFGLLVRSYSKRIDSAELQSAALSKMQDLHQRTVEILEDVRVLRQTRARRKLAREAEGLDAKVGGL